MAERPFPMSDIQSSLPLVQFLTDKIQPPSNIYVGPDESIVVQIRSFTAMNVSIRVRMLRAADGVIAPHEETRPVAGNMLENLFVIPTTEGFLLNVSVIPLLASLQPGETFVAIRLASRGLASTDVRTFLAAGYATQFSPVTWPGTGLNAPTAGRGMFRVVLAADPPANTEIGFVGPTFTLWRIISFHARLVTDATAINRRVKLVASGAGIRFGSYLSSAAQAASLTIDYATVRGVVGGGIANSTIELGYSEPIFLLPGHLLQTDTQSLQAGDNWGPGAVEVEQWAFF